MWPGSINDLPNNPFDYWIPCNGATLSKTAYPELFTILGYTYGGTGDDFNVPDMQNLFVVGTGSAYNIGTTGGSAEVTLDETEMPVHNHGITEPNNGQGHQHSITEYDDSVSFAGGGASSGFDKPKYQQQDRSTTLATTGITINNAGGSGTPAETQAHENRPPYIAMHYIIRIK